MDKTIDPQEIRARAARGAELLDSELPDWAKMIDAKRLDMDCASDCILGQVFGSYQERIRFFTDEEARAGMTVAYGFALSRARTQETHTEFEEEHGFLREAWMEEVTNRLILVPVA